MLNGWLVRWRKWPAYKLVKMANKERYLINCLEKVSSFGKLTYSAFSYTSSHSWAQQLIGDAITQSPSWPEKEKQYAVQTSQSTTAVTTLWDKQSHVYSSFENVHVYQRLNAITIRWHICTVDIHYLEEIRDKLSDWNGKQRHVWTVTCRRSFELSEICFLWVQVWIQVN